jgi:hypothetical protein
MSQVYEGRAPQPSRLAAPPPTGLTASRPSWRSRAIALGAAAALVAGCLSEATPTAAASTSVSISPAAQQVQPGDTFNVDVTINTDTPTRGAQFSLTFDPALLQMTKATVGGFYQDWAKSNQAAANIVVPFKPDNQKGTTTVGAVIIIGGQAGPNDQGPTGTGPMVTVSFTAKSGTSGPAKIEFGNVQISGPNSTTISNVTVTGGTIGVGVDVSQLAQPTPETLASPTALPTSQGATPIGLEAQKLGIAGGSTPQATAPTAGPTQPAAQTPTPQPAAQTPTAQTPAAQSAPAQTPTAPSTPTLVPAAQSRPAQPPAAASTALGLPSASPPVAPAPQSATSVPTPLPAVPPRGSPGLVIPWELVGGFGGGIIATGIVLFALRRDGG